MSGFVRRCVICHTSPLERDFAYFWGDTPDQQADPRCLKCRKGQAVSMPVIYPRLNARKRAPAVVVFISKFVGMPAPLLYEYLLGNTLRDHLMLRKHGAELFITDGLRIWSWLRFPDNKREPLDWDAFLELWPEWALYEPYGVGIREVQPEAQTDLLFAHVKL